MMGSTTGLQSDSDSFHSAVGSSEEATDNEENPIRMDLRRKDSGYSEEISRPIYETVPCDADFDFSQVKANLMLIAGLDRKSDRRITQRTSRKNFSRQQTVSSRKNSIRSHKTKTEHPIKLISRRQSSILSSPSNSVHVRSRNLSRTTSIHSPITAEDPHMVHQKAKEIIQALQSSKNAINSTEAGVPLLCQHSRSIEHIFNHSRSIPPAIASETQPDSHLEKQSSLFYTAANIDWTDPTRRKEAYEKHDRNDRGFRRWLKKITPRHWQTTRLNFYDGNNDTGSVRRYRLDIKDMEESSVTYKELSLSRARNAFTCLPLAKSTSRLEAR